jgi:hypothetical protein
LPLTTGTTETTATGPTSGPPNLFGTDAITQTPPPGSGSDPQGTGRPEPTPPRAPPQDLGDTTVRLSQFGQMFPRIQDVMNEILESNLEMKKINRLDREVRLESVLQSAKTAATEMMATAIFSLAGTIISSSLQITGAAMSAAGAVKAQQKMDEVLKDTSKGGIEQAKIEANTITMEWAKKATIVQESGKIMGSGLTFGGQIFEVMKTEEQARAQREQTRAENESDFRQSAEKMIANVLEKMSEIQRAQSQAITTIARA